MRSATRARSVLGVLLVGSILTLTCQERPAPTPPRAAAPVRVVIKKNANYLVYFVARDKGFLAKHNIAVRETEMESTNLMVQALAAGQADFNPSTSTPALYAAEAQTPGRFKFLYIMLMQRGEGNDAIIVRKEDSIRSLRELAGRSIGAPPGATSTVLLKLIFAKDGLNTERDVKVQEMEPRALLQSLAAKQLNAVFAIEPLITMGEEKGISRTLLNEPIEERIMNPIPIAGGVVTASFAQREPETVTRLRHAMEETVDFIRANNKESRAVLAKAIELPPNTANRLGLYTYWKLNEVQPQYVQQLADLFAADRAIPHRVDTSAMLLSVKGTPARP